MVSFSLKLTDGTISRILRVWQVVRTVGEGALGASGSVLETQRCYRNDASVEEKEYVLQEGSHFVTVDKATLGCRSCLDTDFGDLNYDTVLNGRYHDEVMKIRGEPVLITP